MVARRAAHEPVSRILGHREFWSLDFRLSAATLDPRPDSEILVEAVLDRLDDRARPWRLADLGTGSSCLLLTLLHELPQARGLGIDRAPGAVAMAAENAAMLGLAGRAAFREGDWLAGVTETFDVVLSDPPYIASAEIATRPRGAAARPAGRAGRRRRRARRLSSAAAPGRRPAGPAGLCAVEIGHDQAAAVATLMQAAGFAVEPVLTDLGGRDQVVVGRRKNLLE